MLTKFSTSEKLEKFRIKSSCEKPIICIIQIYCRLKGLEMGSKLENMLYRCTVVPDGSPLTSEGNTLITRATDAPGAKVYPDRHNHKGAQCQLECLFSRK